MVKYLAGDDAPHNKQFCEHEIVTSVGRWYWSRMYFGFRFILLFLFGLHCYSHHVQLSCFAIRIDQKMNISPQRSFIRRGCIGLEKSAGLIQAQQKVLYNLTLKSVREWWGSWADWPVFFAKRVKSHKNAYFRLGSWHNIQNAKAGWKLASSLSSDTSCWNLLLNHFPFLMIWGHI